MTTIYCPDCEIDFEAEMWENGECPHCHREYYWDEFCAEDYSDCWSMVEWEEKK